MTRGRSSWAGRAALALAAAALLGSLAAGVRQLDVELARPLALSGSSYVRSDACVQCHLGKHQSWQRTFHRTMTQDATPAAVLGRFDGRTLVYGGVTARMERDTDGGYRVRFERPLADGAERWEARVGRTVGSRRYQQYLTQHGDTWLRLPIAWNVAEQRFMHVNGAFLTPDPERDAGEPAIAREDYDRHVTRWNDNCVYCHNVAPNPGLDARDGSFDTHVAELGIACEACHGPASAHVARNRNPLRRYALHLAPRLDPTIANPRRMTAERSTQVCGRCHGQRLAPDIEHVHRFGDRFTPGDDLAAFSKPLFRDTTLGGQPGSFEPRFWPDGTPRLTAYEYQGVLLSGCNAGGELHCGSCHGMHEGDPRGQLRPDKVGDAACTSCHAELRETTANAAHTQHRPEGPGARCLDCHMPRIVYGLVDAHRSHRIDSPEPGAHGGRPDACTLCHVDRSARWAADALARWPSRDAREPAPVPAPATVAVPTTASTEIPEATRLLFAGDPIQRAVAAAALGRSGGDTELSLLLDVMQYDRYPAVRAIAYRSLRAVLQRRDASRAPSPEAFTATDDASARAHAAEAIRARTAISVPPGRQAELSALRAQAPEVQISIGE